MSKPAPAARCGITEPHHRHVWYPAPVEAGKRRCDGNNTSGGSVTAGVARAAAAALTDDQRSRLYSVARLEYSHVAAMSGDHSPDCPGCAILTILDGVEQ